MAGVARATVDGRTKIEFGCKITNKKIDWLRPVFVCWGNANQRYADIHCDEGDVGYYYNERTNIGFLAAGAWLAGFSALEEYPAQKKRSKIQKTKGLKHSRKKRGSERVDLYIGTKKESAILEAKMLWGERGQRKLEARMNVAKHEALRNGDALQGIACVFYVPHFKKQDCSTMGVDDSAIRSELSDFMKDADADLWAWCFPKRARKIDGSGKFRDFYYPGVIVALKVVW